jgi:hypothetical protein
MPCFDISYPKGSTFDLIRYSDFDYAGCKVDRKSTSGTCQLLGRLSHPVLKVNRMQTMYVPGSVIHVHSDYINDSS